VTSIEAMSCGKPVLASDLATMRDKINASSGMLVPPRNVTALAAALGAMLDHYQDYSADEIAQYVQNNYSFEAVGLKFAKIYHEVLARKLI